MPVFCLLVKERLDNSSLFKGRVGAVLLDVAEASGRDIDEYGLAKLRNENVSLLKVCLAADLADRIKLGSTSTVGVASSNLRRLSRDCAFASHSFRMVPSLI